MKAIDKAIKKAGTATRLAEMLEVSAMTISHWRNRYQGMVPADRVCVRCVARIAHSYRHLASSSSGAGKGAAC